MQIHYHIMFFIYFPLCVSSEDSCETVQMFRLVRALINRLCNKYQNLKAGRLIVHNENMTHSVNSDIYINLAINADVSL